MNPISSDATAFSKAMNNMNAHTTANSKTASVDVIERAMLAAWAGEPLPELGSPEYHELEVAMISVIGAARPIDMHRLGLAATKALLHFVLGGLQSQRATAQAQIRAITGGARGE
jgi:hypothetical protein